MDLFPPEYLYRRGGQLGDLTLPNRRLVARSKLKPGDTELDAGKLGKLKIVNGSQILLGPSTVFNKENIDKFDF